MKRLLSIAPLLMVAIALAAGCDDNAPSIHATPEGVAEGYDPRAAPGTQAPEDRGDDAVPAAANAGDEMPQGTRILAEPDRAFLLQAVRDNALELKLAEIAQETASRPAVKQYASTIRDEHHKLNQQLMLQSTRQNVLLTDEPGETHERTLAAMRELSGAAFDRAYVQHELEWHEQALARYRAAADEVKDPEVLALITRTLPMMERHLESAKELRSLE